MRGDVPVLTALAALQVGCLPGDTRPEPGSLLVTAVPAPAVRTFATADGWSVSLQRLLVGLGAVELGGDRCTGYSEPRYTRLFDFAAEVDAPQKLALVYGLGECDLAFEVSAPEGDTLVGAGVTQADVELMRVEASDAWVEGPQRTSVLVSGEATREAITKRFEWSFRMEYDIESCAEGDDGGGGGRLDLEAGVVVERTIVVDPAELFVVGFDALAESDVDGDDAITIDELAATAPDGASVANSFYTSRVPRMVRIAGGGECDFELDNR